MQRRELEGLSQCHTISINIRGQNKRNELVYNIDCLKSTPNLLDDDAHPTAFILQEDRMTESFIMRSVCSDDILFVVSGLHSSKVALFVIAGYPAPTLIGRVERCGRFLKIRNEKYEHIFTITLYNPFWKGCFKPPKQTYEMMDRGSTECTHFWCTKELMAFPVNNLSVDNILFAITSCMIINMDIEHSQMVPNSLIPILGTKEIHAMQVDAVRQRKNQKKAVPSTISHHTGKDRRQTMTIPSATSPANLSGHMIDLSVVNVLHEPPTDVTDFMKQSMFRSSRKSRLKSKLSDRPEKTAVISELE